MAGLCLLAPAVLSLTARAGDGAGGGSTLEEVIVTAQKRNEDAQQVSLSLQVLDTRALEQLQVSRLDDYLRYLPSVTALNNGPGTEQLSIRGVTNGSDGLRVGSQPTVAVYLDEQPVTTIVNNIDMHIYDMARIEELSGPQGTLFGSSAMGGALRLITNKPSTAGLSGGYSLEGNGYPAGGLGGKIEGFVNVPLTAHSAVRLVGFTDHEGGYINNVLGPPETYPTSGVARSNASLVRRHYNEISTRGARAALQMELGKSWTVTPSAMIQRQQSYGVPGFQTYLGDLNVARYFPESHADRWWQAALTVQGKVSNLDLVYSASVMDRNVDDLGDYSGYSFYYDSYYAAYTSYPSYFGDNFRDDAGQLISPAMRTVDRERFTKVSHELRLSSPADWQTRFVAGLFLQHQANDTRNEFRVDHLAAIYSITGLPGVQYLNDMTRIDRDRAAFAEVSHDFNRRLSLTGGLRVFGYDNTVYGFFGYNGRPLYGGSIRPSGEQLCFPGSAFNAGPGRPCIDVDQRSERTGSTHKLTLNYRPADHRLLYATWSTGFRPGGINRSREATAYRADTLGNVELGWKTDWPAHNLRFNGSLFQEQWKDPQYTICGTNCVYIVINAGAARIRGLETEVHWAPSRGLALSGALTWLDARLTRSACRYGYTGPYCNNEHGVADATVAPVAPAGTRLPSPRLKGNLIARYTIHVGDYAVHMQASAVAQTWAPSPPPNPLRVPGYGALDLSAGLARDKWTAELYATNALDRRGEQQRFYFCPLPTCTPLVIVPIAPRLVGLSFSQQF
jgi:outer membrane receptor protein involved in Fe transport